MMPDKIYCWSGVLGSFYASPQKPAVKTEEYIRKDALLEWAKKKREQMKIEVSGCSNMTAIGKCLVYNELINKINSL